MSAIQFIFLFSMLGAGPAPTSLDSSAVPADFKQARIQGLHRLNAAELANGFLKRGMTTQSTENFMAKGAASQEIFSSKEGDRRIDKTNNTYCYAPTGKTTQDEESCFAVFRAADGAHYFGYDINRGGHPRVWRSF